jgi:hypothetical protein
MEANSKDGKVKFTFEVEINPAAMELLKIDLDLMGKMGSQAMDRWRENMGQRGKMWQGGHGMGMMMHHGQGECQQNKE